MLQGPRHSNVKIAGTQRLFKKKKKEQRPESSHQHRKTGKLCNWQKDNRQN